MSTVGVPAGKIGSLLVFADDWGRHPSSCQHLVRQLMGRFPVTWVNTIGTRSPRADLATMRRIMEKLRQWKLQEGTANKNTGSDETSTPITVLNPRMWPWFRHRHDRRLNRWLLQRQLLPWIQRMPRPVVGLTALPVTADLTDALPLDRWVYYCVDDFSEWPGLDGTALRRLDRKMIRQADRLVAVSEYLQRMIAREGRSASLLTHGVDLAFWNRQERTETDRKCRSLLQGLPRPLIVFWGVIDRRLQTASVAQLSSDLRQGTILLVGPQQNPDPLLNRLPNVVALPPQPMQRLPSIAAESAVLIMPYDDLPVTRAMQPLKLKEYLATGKAVVVNRLPATTAWDDCLDTAVTPQQFSRMVLNRLQTGVPGEQLVARRRLAAESWADRALQMEQILAGLPAFHTENHDSHSPAPQLLYSCGQR